MKKLSPAASAARRKEVIRLRRSGMKNSEVSKKVRLAPQTTSTYYAEWKRDGKKSLISKERGRPKGTGRILTRDQEVEIICLLKGKNAEIQNTLWTRESIQELIKERLDREMATSTLGDYLKRWGLTSEKNKDISGVASQNQNMYIFLKRGRRRMEKDESIWYAYMHTPLSFSPDFREYAGKVNAIIAFTNTGKVKFYLYEGSLSMTILLDFIKQAKNSSDKEIYIIIYDKNPMKDWDDEHSNECSVYFIPFSSIEIEIEKMIKAVE